jgi:hypothetical protein
MSTELIMPFGAFCLADVDDCANNLAQAAIGSLLGFGADHQPDAIMGCRAINAHDDIFYGLSRRDALRHGVRRGGEPSS